MAGFRFGPFAIGGACGVAAVVVGALSVTPVPTPVRDQVVPIENSRTQTASSPRATPPETDTAEAPGLGSADASKILVETGEANPYSWYRWHLINRDVKRERVMDLLGEPSARNNGTVWKYSKQPGVESTDPMHEIRFRNDAVDHWDCDYIDNDGKDRPELFGDPTRWSSLQPGSPLADVINALGEPTRYRTHFRNGQDVVPVAELEYKIPDGGVGLVQIDGQDKALYIKSPPF
jgi:hypothetical protein